jgi:short-subunit dehydrogenase
MQKNPILVFGATGKHGNTGYTVAKGLLENNFPVRLTGRQERKIFP